MAPKRVKAIAVAKIPAMLVAPYGSPNRPLHGERNFGSIAGALDAVGSIDSSRKTTHGEAITASKQAETDGDWKRQAYRCPAKAAATRRPRRLRERA